MDRFDVAVIGGGSGGYAAARTSFDAGARVAIIDHGPLGGLCILRGCMPSKTILRSAEIMSYMRRGPEFGLSDVEPQADLKAIIERKNKLVKEFADYRIDQLRDGRFALYEEEATFLSPTMLRVGSETIEAMNIIIATGSIPNTFDIPGIDKVGYITSDEALELQDKPDSMLVLGGGPTALELAQFFSRIDTKVTLIQRSKHILSSCDEDLSLCLEGGLRSEGMQIFTGTQIQKFETRHNLKFVFFEHEGETKKVTGDIILHSLGRRPNVDKLNLAAANIKTKNGRILVDDEMRTNQPHIFAVGDVNGLNEIVHVAIEQGEIAAYNATNSNKRSKRVDNKLALKVTFTDPQIASVGLSEKECLENDITYLSASYPFNDHGKSMCLGQTHGHVKLICTPPNGEIIGAHIAGPEASELIHEIVAVMYFGGTATDLTKIPHYHPTLAEIFTYPADEIMQQLMD